MRRPAAILAATAALVALAPMPALAKAEPTMRAGEIAAKLNDPAMQSALTGMISAMTRAMLDMPAAPFVNAMSQASGKKMRNLPEAATITRQVASAVRGIRPASAGPRRSKTA